MAPARRYTSLSNPRSSLDTEHEMDSAFDDDDSGETAPLTLHQPRSPISIRPPSLLGHSEATAPNAYDFERDYDYPPPGSPPAHSTFALPNNYGNSNGHLPTSPVLRSPPQSIFRRTFGAFLPQSYQRVRGDGRPRGGGTDNDGVFANVTAKPAPLVSVRANDGDVRLVPEETPEDVPPSYVAASADAVPSYWETVVHAPSALDLNGDMVIDDLPTGSVLVFIFTTIISWFFQLPGFILTYLLHATHAGRFGSQAGLALTFIQWGFGTTVMGAFPAPDDPPLSADDPGLGPAGPGPGAGGPPPPGGLPVGGAPDSGMMGNSTMMDGSGGSTLADMQLPYAGREWISFLLMTIGWFLLLTSMIGYFRVKRFELSVRASRSVLPTSPSAEDVQRDMASRRDLADIFGINVIFNSVSGGVVAGTNTNSTPPHSPDTTQQGEISREIEEARIRNVLRNAFLL